MEMCTKKAGYEYIDDRIEIESNCNAASRNM